MFVGEEAQFKAFIQTFLAMPRHENGLPIRNHFQPMQHAHLLPWLTIAQWHDENSITLNLIGEQVKIIAGGAALGTNLYSIYDDNHVDTFKELHSIALTTPLIYMLNRKITKTDGVSMSSTSYSIPATTEDGKSFFIYTLIHIADMEVATFGETNLKDITLDDTIHLTDMGASIPDTISFPFKLKPFS